MGQYDFAAAVDAFRMLSVDYPASAETSFNLAVALVNRQGPDDTAEADARLRALEAHPTVGLRARYARGLLLLHQGRDAEAGALLSGVAAAVPADAYPAYFAGQARLAAAPAEALPWFEKAAAIDPLLRSARYGAFQALQRTGRATDAAVALAAFERTAPDPRARLAEFKYTRMGALAEAAFVDRPLAPVARPAGARFSPPLRLLAADEARTVATAAITVADIDGDGGLDLFVADAAIGATPNLVLLGRGDTRVPDPTHPLAAVTAVRAALWGDLDDDGLCDVVLVRGAGRSALWRQTARGQWRDVTTTSRTATPTVDAVDGALVDADHDGDLDIWLVNGRGKNVLLNNNGNGTFRDIAAEAGVAGDGRPSIGVAFADLDGDRDHDLVVLKATPPHDVFLNDRVWRYHRAPGYEAFTAAPSDAVLAADLDADGRAELYTSSRRGLERWRATDAGAIGAQALAGGFASPAGRARLALADTDGDGALEIVASSGAGWAAFEAGTAAPAFVAAQPVSAWAVATFSTDRGPSVIGRTPAGLVEWAPGAGRLPYAVITLTGRSQASDQRRSNGSGIGTRVHVRTGSQWTAFDTVRLQSGPGQSLQPMSVGLRGAARADLVSLLWPDGVLQSEIGLEAGRHVIEETQRQLSSCPVLFAFDGRDMRFVTDLLGVGGIGFFERPGVYSPPVPREHVLIPEGAVQVVDGQYRLAIAEPMEEVAYLDRLALVAYDLPPGWQMALDERKAVTGAAPTGAPVYFRDERVPVRAVTGRGDDVTAALVAADLRAAPVGRPDPRFIGRTEPQVVVLEFDRPLDAGAGDAVLVVDGWVEYPYAQTVFAAWQAGAPYLAPTLEARDGAGRWHLVAPEFGYPAGMPRRMTLPLPSLPADTTALRLRTTQEIYWDRITVARAESLGAVVMQVLPLAAATLHDSGFARRTTGPQRTPFYDHAVRAPLWDTRHPRGYYTRFGDVAPLVGDADDALVVLGPGEEVSLAFTAPATPLPAGWTRRLVVQARGWCKDMDLYTEDGETVEPLPGRATAARARLHGAFNTRFESGH